MASVTFAFASTAVSPRVRLVRHLLVVSLLSLSGFLVFRSGLRAGFLSDTFIFLEVSQAHSLSWFLRHYIPQQDAWYRPTTELVFWLEVRAFGMNPLGYHLVALACHVASAVLLYVIALRLKNNQLAAALAGFVFLLSIHAQEVVYDIADLHNALGGVALLAAVLSYLTGMRRLALLATVIALTIDEAALLMVGLVGLYELLSDVDRTHWKLRLRQVLLPVLPFAALAVAYVAFRVLVTQAGFYNETEPCRTPRCLVTASADYVNRLFVRPDRLRSEIWLHRSQMAATTLVAGAVVLLLLRTWQWRRWRPILFSLGWVAGASAFFILTLYPYVVDRFVYIPDMGLALLIGAITSDIIARWQTITRPARIGAIGVGLLLVPWLGMGISMLWYRGELYADAGEHAEAILENTLRALPDPPPNTVLVIRNVPRDYTPAIPPGNTGPFLFHNGLPSALRLKYDRGDLIVFEEAEIEPGSPPANAIWLEIQGSAVVPLSPITQ